jgi:uncharacterized membrane protein (GlpM family)
VVQVTPLPVWHGQGYRSLGFRFGDVCYIRYKEIQLFNLFSILSTTVNLIGKYYVIVATSVRYLKRLMNLCTTVTFLYWFVPFFIFCLSELSFGTSLKLGLTVSIAFIVVLLQAIVLILSELARMHLGLIDRPQRTLGFQGLVI